MPIVSTISKDSSPTNIRPPRPALRPIKSTREASNSIAVYHCIIYKVAAKNTRDKRNHNTTIAMLVIINGVLIRK